MSPWRAPIDRLARIARRLVSVALHEKRLTSARAVDDAANRYRVLKLAPRHPHSPSAHGARDLDPAGRVLTLAPSRLVLAHCSVRENTVILQELIDQIAQPQRSFGCGRVAAKPDVRHHGTKGLPVPA